MQITGAGWANPSASTWFGGQIGRWLGWYKEGHAAGFLMSVVGAVILLVILRFVG
jgi:uncharacterized membrane protein YeaQ/YmgE (transglycosylase-associated protein family)